MIRVKICGLNDPAGFDEAVAAGADWVGFVFFAASPRAVSAEAAAALSARHPGGPLRVGLFVDPDEADVARVLARLELDALQIYAPPARAAALGRHFARPVWHAQPVASRADLPSSAEGLAALVIEPRPPKGATRPGGNAQQLEWDLLRGWPAPCPWLLAGGLTPANVAAAIAASGAEAVDVSSGVESTPGQKSPVLIREFIAAAKMGPGASAPAGPGQSPGLNR